MKIIPALIDGVKQVNENIDFIDHVEGKNEIINFKKCHVSGTITKEYGLLKTDLDIVCDLVLSSTRTLKPIDYHLEFNLDLIFGESKDADYSLIDEIDFTKIIYGHILVEKPLTIFNIDETPLEKEKAINPAFESLKALDKL